MRVASAHASINVKRDLLKCQKSPISVSKETYYSVKRDLIRVASAHASINVNRDLLKCQKRPHTPHSLQASCSEKHRLT